MTLLEAVEEANLKAGIRTFRYARIDEWNSFQDSFKFIDYPAHVIVPIRTNGSWVAPGMRRKGVAIIEGWVVQRIPEDTTDFRTQKAEDLYLEPMKQLAMKFIRHMIDSDIVDPEVNNISDSIRPEYMWLSTGLFGAAYTLQLPIVETVC